MYIAGLEFMKNRNRNCPVGHRGEERNGPIDLVPRTYSHLVAFLKAAVLEKNMQFGDSLGKIPVEDRGSPIV